jgi:6-phospho-3-hexuloisomerase
MNLSYKKVLIEIEEALNSSDFSDIENFVKKIITSNQIVVYGAGRVGLMMRTFAMRLTHLNLDCYFLGDSSLKKTADGDLLIIGSGSGNTKSVVSIAEIAKNKGLELICISANPNSTIAKLCSSRLILNCDSKEHTNSNRSSIQPMTTLFEQTLLILLDSIVLILMKNLNEDHFSMLERHNVIE